MPPSAASNAVDRRLQRRDVADVAEGELRRRETGSGEAGDQRLAARHIDVDELDAGALRGKMLDHAFADAARAAGDEHRLLLEARVSARSRS